MNYPFEPKEFIPRGNCYIISPIATIVSSGNAASAQESAAQTASNTQLEMFNQTQQNLQPYMESGAAANTALVNATGLNSGGDPLTSALLAPPTSNLSEAALRATPGYQFNLNQGLESVQNSAAARGLGTSGAALKGASEYATGLADSTYQNQFNNAVTTQTNSFNRLLSLAQLGQSSAVNQGNIGQQTAANIGANAVGAGNAIAANDIAASNSIGSAASNLGTLAYLSQNTNAAVNPITGGVG